MLRKGLDRLYLAAAWLAAANLVGLLVMVLAGIVGRLVGFNLAGADAYAGYCMAAAAFLALAHTLGRGEHIRVNLLLGRAGPTVSRALDLAAHGLGALLAVGFAIYAIRLAWFSWRLGDVSQGTDATPLWLPQLSMAGGFALFALAMLDAWARLLVTGRSVRLRSGAAASTTRDGA